MKKNVLVIGQQFSNGNAVLRIKSLKLAAVEIDQDDFFDENDYLLGQELNAGKEAVILPLFPPTEEVKSWDADAPKYEVISTTQILPGAILVSSWGWEQTNIDFYIVDTVKNGWATVSKCKNITSPEIGFMTNHELPGLRDDSFKPVRRKIKNYGGEDYVVVEYQASATPWDGKVQTSTHYA